MTTSQHAAVRLLAQRILEIGYEDLPARERHVIERVANRLAVSRDINVDYDEGLTFGQRLSDRIAALQAPVIMMSQNRQAAKDRLQASHDYEVNLKAEIEIMALHEKLDEIRNKDLADLIRSLRK